MNIVNVGYDSTNYYVLADTRPRLLIDVGWPGTLPKLQHQCQRLGLPLADIKHFVITHYHPDHAGLAQELKRLGSQLIVLESQAAAVPILKTHMKPQHNYVPIDLADAIRLNLSDSRVFLAGLGIAGEMISTPGHSDDSVTVVLDEGRAFTGDLTHPLAIGENAILRQSWARIRALGVKTVYPGHGPVWQLE
ncbi:MAG TPA: MBL fold metallo-hydrolase [Phototrophicaceae bacterium]|nr:MBL fold metallo-hydrolase [Phototrophicaceae bacterium]